MIIRALRLAALAAALGASACNSTPEELVLFHTNDIHSHLRASKIEPFGLGGLARLSTLLRSLRAQAPLSLTLDAGDWSEGTWYFTIDAGQNMLRILNTIGYDAVCVGNHDFLDGPDTLISIVSASGATFPVLAANLDMSAYPRAAELAQWVPPYVIKQVGDLKIGLIGLTTFEPMYNQYFAPVNITEPIAAASAVAKTLRSQVDVLGLITHNDISSNEEFAAAVPGIDFVISGHSHAKTPTPALAQNAGRSVPVVEAGEWGKFLGELHLLVDKSAGTVNVKSYALHPITPDIPEDATIAALVSQQDAALDAKYSDDVTRVVAQADIDLVQKDGMETPLGNLAVQAYRAHTHTDIAIEELSLTGVSIAHGAATLMDVHDVIPHIYNPTTGKEWTLHVWNAKGSDLLLMFNIFYTVNGLMPLGNPIGWLSADGVSVVWEPGTNSKPGARAIPAVKSLLVGGAPLDPNARYTVTLSDGMWTALTIANSEFSLGVDLSQLEDTGLEAWRPVVDYAASLGHLTLAQLGVGGHSTTQGPDLAVFYYGVGYDGHALSVQVSNLGQAPATAASLTCQSGAPNGMVVYNTSSQTWTPIGSAAVPALSPGQSVTIAIPWESAGLAAGVWPLDCAVSGGGDVYPTNNDATLTVKLPLAASGSNGGS
jgi:5'-nucleotidase